MKEQKTCQILFSNIQAFALKKDFNMKHHFTICCFILFKIETKFCDLLFNILQTNNRSAVEIF